MGERENMKKVFSFDPIFVLSTAFRAVIISLQVTKEKQRPKVVKEMGWGEVSRKIIIASMMI